MFEVGDKIVLTDLSIYRKEGILNHWEKEGLLGEVINRIGSDNVKVKFIDGEHVRVATYRNEYVTIANVDNV